MTKRISPHSTAPGVSGDSDDGSGSDDDGGVSSAEVRAWARSNGLLVSDRSRISADGVTAWQSR